jgi:pimeloyl-ACP methyl ester carboxylesterase
MPRSALSTHYIHLDKDIDIAYFDSGGQQHKPTLLFLHGVFDHKGTWNQLVEELPAYRAVAPDLVGHGQSSKPLLRQMAPQERYSPDMQAEYLSQFIEKLELESLVLVGSSLGGGIALRLYLDYPAVRAKTHALVLVAAAGYPQALPGHVHAMGHWLGRFLQSAAGGKLARSLHLADLAAHRSIQRCFYDRQKIPDQLYGAAIAALQHPNAFYAYRYSALNITPPDLDTFHSRFAEINCPTLVFWGRDDRVINPLAALRFAADIAGAELQVFDECGHAPHIECAPAVAQHLLIFLKRCFAV